MNRGITVFLITSAAGLILIIGTGYSGRFYATIKKHNFLMAESICGVLQEESKYLYLGADKCASVCHNNKEMGFQYDKFLSSPHAKSFEILTSEKALRYARNANKKENPQECSLCLKCHVTGGGLDSSFFADTYKKEDGVTCEACHKKEYVPKSFLPVEEDCLKCHKNSVHRIHKFDFRERFERIAHPRPEAINKEK
jgi:hypothetical protein